MLRRLRADYGTRSWHDGLVFKRCNRPGGRDRIHVKRIPVTCPVRGRIRGWPRMKRTQLVKVLRTLLVECCALTPEKAREYASQSLRRGGMSAGIELGFPLLQLMQHGRWSTPEVALSYVRDNGRLQAMISSQLLS